MNDKNLHSNHLEEKSTEFFSGGKIVWDKSEADVWTELSEKILDKPSGKKVLLFPEIMKYAAAAVIFIALSFGILTVFYQKTVVSKPGEHLTVQLPDKSVVELNAGSQIKYHPLKWILERKVKLEGEAFFQVEKGKKFSVLSKNGTTEVLGTTFDIYSRDETYRVTCLTGQVKVESVNDNSVILLPGSQAEIKEGKIVVGKNINTDNIVSWRNNQFFFAGTPLHEVIDEIERQYGVTIKIQSELYNRNFAGNFPKKYSVEEVLDFVCKTMQVKFVKQSENEFLIVENS